MTDDEEEPSTPVSLEELCADVEKLIAILEQLPTPLDSQLVATGVLKTALNLLEQARRERGE